LTNPNFAYWVLQINCLLSEKRGVIKRNFQYALFGLSRVVCVNHVRLPYAGSHVSALV